jgi:hypothetical protein
VQKYACAPAFICQPIAALGSTPTVRQPLVDGTTRPELNSEECRWRPSRTRLNEPRPSGPAETNLQALVAARRSEALTQGRRDV